MTSGQRKAHKIIWLLLVIIVPAFIFVSIKDLYFNQAKSNTLVKVKASKETILKSAENNLIKANIYESQLEIILKSPLKNASSIVYETNQKGSKGKSLGQLNAVGIYKFNIMDLPKGILVFDSLKDIEITKLTF